MNVSAHDHQCVIGSQQNINDNVKREHGRERNVVEEKPANDVSPTTTSNFPFFLYTTVEPLKKNNHTKNIRRYALHIYTYFMQV